MIGYIKPKKLRKVREISRATSRRKSKDSKDVYYKTEYEFEYYDEKNDVYENIGVVTSEVIAQMRIQSMEWQRQITEELDELDAEYTALALQVTTMRAEIDKKIRRSSMTPYDEAEQRADNEKLEELNRRKELLLKQEKQMLQVIEECSMKSDVGCMSWLGVPKNEKFDELRRSRFKKTEHNGENKWYIDLTEEEVGTEKRIYGKDMFDLMMKIQAEEDMLRTREHKKTLSARYKILIRAARERIIGLNAAETRKLLELFYIAVFGDKLDREIAREMIYDMLDMENVRRYVDEKSLNMQYYADQQTKGLRYDVTMCQDYITDYLQSRGALSQNRLAQEADYPKSSLSRFIRGELNTLKRPVALKLALAMELSREDIIIFMLSANHVFPYSPEDFDILRHLETGDYSYKQLIAMVGSTENKKEEE